MKKSVLSLLIALMAIVVANAQQISVVSEGATSLYGTLQEAIENAPEGSVIYLPGGQFSISDAVKITKKLTIIGIGHYLSNEGSEDGFTKIEGNLWLNEGSSGSSVMACYITGNVYIGDGGATVNDVLIRYCNLKYVSVASTCMGTVLNQNYIRDGVNINNGSAKITNNIVKYIYQLDGGVVSNNIITSVYTSSYDYALYKVYYSIITGNISLTTNHFLPSNSSSNSVSGNMGFGSSYSGDESFIRMYGIDKNDVFEHYGSISPASNFHFKDEYKQYENQVGIYADTGFNDKQQAPVPYIVDHQVDNETDASGKLNIHIRVKASE